MNVLTSRSYCSWSHGGREQPEDEKFSQYNVVRAGIAALNNLRIIFRVPDFNVSNFNIHTNTTQNENQDQFDLLL